MKHKYSVWGVTTEEGYLFRGTCVAEDIIDAVTLLRGRGYSVWGVEKKEQVSSHEDCGVLDIVKLGVYESQESLDAMRDGVKEKVLNCDLDAVDSIMTLEEAKDIIKILMSRDTSGAVDTTMSEAIKRL